VDYLFLTLIGCSIHSSARKREEELFKDQKGLGKIIQILFVLKSRRDASDQLKIIKSKWNLDRSCILNSPQVDQAQLLAFLFDVDISLVVPRFQDSEYDLLDLFFCHP